MQMKYRKVRGFTCPQVITPGIILLQSPSGPLSPPSPQFQPSPAPCHLFTVSEGVGNLASCCPENTVLMQRGLRLFPGVPP